jgi:CheY-like chemotaxis protein
MKLETLSLDLLTQAVSVYWGRAYASDTGAMPNFGNKTIEGPEDVLALFQKEVVELTPGQTSVRYTMRLGNRNYPFMKLLLQEHLIAGEYFFAVDTHDEMDIKPDLPDYEAWMQVRRFNYTLKRDIESSFAAAGLDTAARIREMAVGREEIEAKGRGRSILVVDDEEDLAECVESLLRARGYRMHKVYDGQAALRLAAEIHPDLILLDYELPEMDGLEVIAALRSDEATKDVPILLTTASRVSVQEISRADGFLAKPFHEKLLYEVVERILGTRQDPAE